MSLVAYAASSDEESDNEDSSQSPRQGPVVNGHISDDDEDYLPSHAEVKSHKPMLLSLPKPIHDLPTLGDVIDDTVTPIFSKLPMPKDAHKADDAIEEEDDEFLHKKAVPLPESDIPKPPPPLAPKSSVRTKAKIMIPSMKEFADVDEDMAKSGQQIGAQTQIRATKTCGLLAVLPKAKSEQNFAKLENRTAIESAPSTSRASNIKPAFIPDTVKNRRPATVTEYIDGVKTTKAPTKTAAAAKASKLPLVDCSDSEASDDNDDDELDDFFSLNDDEKLPEVNTNELNVMIAKRAAKISDTAKKYLESKVTEKEAEECDKSDDDDDEEEMRRAQKRYHESQLNEEALQALVGSKSKRRRQNESQIQIVDISGSQVLPDRDEWMRTALASSTTYQPTGVLVDEEPASGTRRKHQITYLAHKAKANEAELQAMWAANRQNRRATQSKYGF